MPGGKSLGSWLQSQGITNHDTPDIGELASTRQQLYNVFCHSPRCANHTYSSSKKGRLLSHSVTSIPFICPHCKSGNFIHTTIAKADNSRNYKTYE